MVYIFDVPYLIKCVRNTLMTNNITVNGEEVKWEHIETLYEIESSKDLRMAPKLSEAHIYPINFQKMKEKYAAQVFSSTVASGLYNKKQVRLK